MQRLSMKAHDEMIAAIEAHKRGDPVQYCYLDGSGWWHDTDKAIFDFSLKRYRPKPKPRVWYVMTINGEPLAVFKCRKSVTAGTYDGTPDVVQVREVLPGDE